MKTVTLPGSERISALHPTVNTYLPNEMVTTRIVDALGQHAGMTHTGRELAIVVKDTLWAAVTYGELGQDALPDTLSCAFLWLGEFILDNDVLADAAAELRTWEVYFSQQ